jgi:hypothetical protein
MVQSALVRYPSLEGTKPQAVHDSSRVAAKSAPTLSQSQIKMALRRHDLTLTNSGSSR